MLKAGKICKALLILLQLLLHDESGAQSFYNFTGISTVDGLSANTVNVIVQDRQGYIWFGTSNGLNKYNGTNFTIYRHAANDSLSIPGNEVQALYLDKKGGF